ncbi:methionyl-tRNA formyltransferase [Comamonas flocculans]|uniref:Methionyl-tRNA formyltransferase n=1 Tax=Comamonas flocculans TaxID=2597701 RepID=A0A5B8RVU0_9BURK|nr:methionyl-tRNA formyltransferase [Comamonas flocculans]QEA12804.1 methionyl-tRNA formyltransferase [Comamonas flocculans]
MRLAFAGTPEFAQQALQALLDAGLEVALVLTQPDRPAGRGMQLQASPVKQCALRHGLALAQPRSLRLDGRYPEDAAQARAALLQADVDAMVVAAYGLILPQWVLDAPRLGCLNIHASLLPRWRGAAPIHRAIEAGDAETGVTIMQMDAGLDTGPMLLREALPIAPRETTGSLHDKLARLGGELIVRSFKELAEGGLQPTPQPDDGVSYAHKVSKAESLIDWSRPAAAIERQVRAFNPFPVAQTEHGGTALKVWDCEIDSCLRNSGGRYGHILLANEAGIRVACGEGTALRLTALQRAGGKRLAAAEFLRGHPMAAGDMLGGQRA